MSPEEPFSVEALRIYTEQMFADMRRLQDERATALHRATERLDADYAERFRAVNEFRAQQGDIIARFLPRAEYEQAHAGLLALHSADIRQLTERLTELKATVDRNTGSDAGDRARAQAVTTTRTQIILAVSVVIAAFGVIAGLIIAFRG